MGAWGHKSFQNDDALDWVADLERDGLRAVAGAFAKVPDEESEYLEAPDASAAIAAAEVVAALNGKPSMDLPESVTTWLKGKPKPTPQLVERARIVLNRIIENSELKDLWDDSGEEDWTNVVNDLQSRLS